WFFVLCIRCPIPTANGQVFNPGCLLPFEQAKQVHRVDQLCTSAEGTDSREQNRIQNRVKNNFCAKGPPVTVSVETFALLQNAVDEKQIPAGTIQAVPADRSALTNI